MDDHHLCIRQRRELAGLTQTEFGSLLGLTQSQVSRLEAQPETTTLELVVKIAKIFGQSVGDLFADPIPSLEFSLEPGIRSGVHDLEDVLNAALDRGRADHSEPASGGIPGLRDVRRSLGVVYRRPRVVVCGRFDSGKSSLINRLLDARAMPVRFAPTTSAVVHIRHVEIQPKWMDAPVWALDDRFEPERWDDEKHVSRHRLASGGLDILDGHAARSGAISDTAYVLVFHDAPILRFCDLVDTPGDDHCDSDEQRAHATERFADVVVHLSAANGFLAREEITQLSRRIRVCPGTTNASGLLNLFVVATHAVPTSMTDVQLDDLQTQGAGRLHLQMAPPDDVDVASQWSAEALRERIYGYYDSNGVGRSRGQEFLDDLKQHLTVTLPDIRYRELYTAFDERCTKWIADLDAAAARIRTADRAGAELPTAEKIMKRVSRETLLTRVRLEREADHMQSRCHKEIEAIYARVVSTTEVRQQIDVTFSAKGLRARGDKRDRKKAAQQDIGGVVLNQLTARLESLLACEARDFSSLVDQELIDLTTSVKSIDREFGEFQIDLDLTGAFVGGAFATAAVGALSAWASTLGNLGAYVIAAEAAGWLSTIGISLPAGGATLTTAMAALGGPLGIALAIVSVGVIGGLFFRSDWEDRLAKAVVREFKKRHRESGKTVKDLLNDSVDTFWGDTRNSVRAGLASVVKAHRRRVRELRRLVGPDLATQELRAELLETVDARREWFESLAQNVRELPCSQSDE